MNRTSSQFPCSVRLQYFSLRQLVLILNLGFLTHLGFDGGGVASVEVSLLSFVESSPESFVESSLLSFVELSLLSSGLKVVASSSLGSVVVGSGVLGSDVVVFDLFGFDLDGFDLFGFDVIGFGLTISVESLLCSSMMNVIFLFELPSV